MRDYILTANERDIINEYLTTGKKLDGFKLVLSRARKHNHDEIKTDEELIQKLLKKAGDI
jgi:hypothetical protein